VAEFKLAKGWRRVMLARDAGAFVLDEEKGIIWYIDEAPAEAWGPEPKAPAEKDAVVDAVRRILPPGYPDTPEGMIRFLESGGLPTARLVPASDTKATS